MRLLIGILSCLMIVPVVCLAEPPATPAGKPVVQRTLLFIRDGNVWTCDSAGGNPLQLTNSLKFGKAQWVSRGKMVAAFVVDDEGTVGRVDFMSPEGGRLGKVSGNVVQLSDLPDGRTVALVQRPRDRWDALEVPVVRNLTGLRPGNAPSLSPDGHTIAYHVQSRVNKQSDPSSVIWLTELAAGSKPRRLSPPLGDQVYEGNASYANYYDQATDLRCWSSTGDRIMVYRYLIENGDWGASGAFITPVDHWAPVPSAAMGCCSQDFQWRPLAGSEQIAGTEWARHGASWAFLVEGEKVRALPDLSTEKGWEGSPQNSKSLGWSKSGRYVLTLSEDDPWVALTDVDAGRVLKQRLEGADEAVIDPTETLIAYVKGGQVYVAPLAALDGEKAVEGKLVGAGKSVAWRP